MLYVEGRNGPAELRLAQVAPSTARINLVAAGCRALAGHSGVGK